MLEFDDSLFLFLEDDSTMSLTTRIFLLSSQFVHMEILSLIFEIPNGSPVKVSDNWNTPALSSNFIPDGISFLILIS